MAGIGIGKARCSAAATLEVKMTLIDVHPERTANPVDEIELIAVQNDWSFERADEDEIAISIAGEATDYHVAVSWLGEMEALHVACAFGVKVPVARRNEVIRLLALVNEQLWIGHFDIWQAEGVVMYRNTLLLAGQAEATAEQMEVLIDTAVEICERHRLAFDFVISGGRNAKEALDHALLETVGEA